MKPGMELVKQWRIDGEKLSLSGDAALMNQANADELQTWLRKAHAWTWEVEDKFGTASAAWLDVIREKLLGTTRLEDGK